MKRFLLLVPMLCILTLLNSCIKDEPLNAECDIEGVDPAWFEAHKSILIGKPIVKNEKVIFMVKEDADLNLAPEFILTGGAKLMMEQDGKEIPAHGVVRDFTTPQIYTVYSEDGNWKKKYIVTFSARQIIEKCSFEHFELDNTNRYQQWFEVSEKDKNNPRRECWATGNGGFALTGMGKGVDSYPTVSDPDGVKGACVKLATRSTGFFGNTVKMPIAAGNIFVGTFNTQIAMMQPRLATGFGLPCLGGKPVTLEGYYKYTAGEVMTDAMNQKRPELKDTADIYAVVYEVDADPEKFLPLNGDEVLTSKRIVMMARIADPGEPQEWKHFSEPFRLMNDKTFDNERLARNEYSIAIVATSSRQGAYFLGAVGSVLYIDELEVVYENDMQQSAF